MQSTKCKCHWECVKLKWKKHVCLCNCVPADVHELLCGRRPKLVLEVLVCSRCQHGCLYSSTGKKAKTSGNGSSLGSTIIPTMLDSLLCSMAPLLCLVNEVPELQGSVSNTTMVSLGLHHQLISALCSCAASVLTRCFDGNARNTSSGITAVRGGWPPGRGRRTEKMKSGQKYCKKRKSGRKSLSKNENRTENIVS